MGVLGWMGLREEREMKSSQATLERGCVWMLFLAWSWEKKGGGGSGFMQGGFLSFGVAYSRTTA